MKQKTINIKDSIKLTNWLSANHDKLVKESMTRGEAAKLFMEQTGIAVSDNRFSAQAKALDWTDWPTKSAGDKSGNRRPTGNVKAIAACLRDILNYLQEPELDEAHLTTMRDIVNGRDSTPTNND